MCILVTQYIGHVELRKALWSARLQWEPHCLQPSCSCIRLPQVLRWSYSLTTSSLQSLTSDSKARREETSYKQSSLFPCQGKIAFFAALVWCSHKPRLRQPLKNCQVRYLLSSIRIAFSCSATSEDKNWAKWKKLSSLDHLFCSSHYCSHCLKSNPTSAFSAREEINCMAGTFSSWSTVSICQLSSRWMAPICTVALQSHLRGHIGLRSHFCLGELTLVCRYFKSCIHHSALKKIMWSTGTAQWKQSLWCAALETSFSTLLTECYCTGLSLLLSLPKINRCHCRLG